MVQAVGSLIDGTATGGSAMKLCDANEKIPYTIRLIAAQQTPPLLLSCKICQLLSTSLAFLGYVEHYLHAYPNRDVPVAATQVLPIRPALHRMPPTFAFSGLITLLHVDGCTQSKA